MQYLAAVWANGRYASGSHHGEAYGRLCWEDKLCADVCSGHLNPDGTFTSELAHEKKSIIIVRHGESEHNAGINNNLDSSLTNNGHCQANAVAIFLNKQFEGMKDHVGYVSPLLRCLQTARFIRQQTGMTFHVLPHLSEITNHYPEDGISVPSRCEQFPEFNWEDNEPFYFPKENEQSFLSRLKLSFAQFAENSVIITHGTVVMTLCEMALGINVQEIPKWDNSIGNCTLSYVRDGTVMWFGRKVEDLS